MRYLINVLITALGFWAAIWLLPGMNLVGDADRFGRFLVLVIISIIFGLINATVGKILKFLSIPITCLTLGLFTFIINAALLELTAWISQIFTVELVIDSFFWTAILGSIIISLVTSVCQWFVNKISG